MPQNALSTTIATKSGGSVSLRAVGLGNALVTSFGGMSARYVSLNGNLLVVNGACTLSRVCVVTPGATSTLTIYDNNDASGDVIAVIDTTEARSIEFGVTMTTGIAIAATGGTPAKFTIVYGFN